jgi:thioredoxin-related protein
MFQSLMTTLLFLLFFTTSLFSNATTVDINHLSLQAKKDNKHLLLFFHKDGCGFCEKMFYDTLGDSDIEEIIDKYFIFIDIGIDDEGSILHRDFNGSKHGYAKSLEIGFYPTVGFVDANNSIIYGVIGYREIELFSLVLKYIYSAAYKVMGWEEFKSKVEFESEE